MLPFPLRCPSCHHGNPVGANFCNNCGMPVNLESCGRCDAINQRGAVRCHNCGSVLSPFREPEPDSCDAAINERGANFSEGPEHTRTTAETSAVRPGQPVEQDFAAPATRPAPESKQEVVARRRSPGMRAAVMAVMLVALAVPGYVAYQDPAQFREGLDAITQRLDAPSAVQPAPSPSPPPMPVDDPASPQRDAAPVLPTLQVADTTHESQPQPSKTATETQSPTPRAASNSKAPQAGKNVRQTRSSATGSKQGNSSRKVVRPKASDARTRAKSSDARPAESTAKAAGSELMP